VEKTVPLKGEEVCRICGKAAGRRDRVNVGDGFYCTDCLGDKFDPVKEKALESPDTIREDGSRFANLLFFFIIGLPIALSFFGWPNLFLGFLAMVHEMGHFVVMLADIFLPGDNWFLVVLAGGVFEFFVPFLSFLYVYPYRKIFVVSCLFLAASGIALMDTGRYMASAQDPSGSAFISGRPVTYQNHDWHLIFAQLDILDHSSELSELFSTTGLLLEYVGFYTAIAAFFLAGGRFRQSGIFLYGITLSIVHTILFGEYGLSVWLIILGAFLLAYLKISKEG
jgi:hypothetical protein